jgi:hypothetical protein
MISAFGKIGAFVRLPQCSRDGRAIATRVG